MDFDRSDTLSQEDREAISALTEDLQSIIKYSIPLLSRELHAENGDNSNPVREELKRDATQAQNDRRRELRDYLQHHALEDVYKKIHERMIEEDSEDLQEAAEFVIISTRDDTLTLLWLHGELFGLINPNNHESDVKFMLAQKDRIMDLLTFVFDTYIKSTPDEERIFYNRTNEALQQLVSPVTTNPPLASSDLARNVNAVVRSTNNLLSHVRY